MKVLAVAYALSPYQGSEFGMGWNFVSALSRRCELHVITGDEYADDVRRYFELHPEERAFFHLHVVHMHYRKHLCRRLWPPAYYWYYKRWHKKALALARTLEAQEHFDLTHQLNMIGYREPGYLWQLGLPHVWGPVGGFNVMRWQFLPELGVRGCVFFFLHNVINLAQMHLSRRVRAAVAHTRELIAATQDSQSALLRLYGRHSTVVCEVGLTPSPAACLHERQAGEPLRVCWAGLHIPRKALPFLLRALPQVEGEVELHVMGEGERTAAWKRLAARLGLRRVVWHGWVSREETLRTMQSSDVFVITSVADATSTVLLEALSMGLPVVCLDHLGFAGVVTDLCGIKIPVGGAREIEAAIARALSRLAADEPLRRRLARGALVRAQDFSWEAKADVIMALYQRVALERR